MDAHQSAPSRVLVHGGALVRDGRIAAIRHGALARECLDLDGHPRSVRAPSSSSILGGTRSSRLASVPPATYSIRRNASLVVLAEVVD